MRIMRKVSSACMRVLSECAVTISDKFTIMHTMIPAHLSSRGSDGLDDLLFVILHGAFEPFDLAITHDPQFLADRPEEVNIVRNDDHPTLKVLRRAD